MDDGTKIVMAKKSIEKAIVSYKKALEKIGKENDNEKSKEIVKKIEEEIDKLNRTKTALERIEK